ncbi:MAG: hypothetical protein KGL39_11260 [Patescibacteria group bacterium]|nr:hypothetical protein [Patescibacteria group bacterium]
MIQNYVICDSSGNILRHGSVPDYLVQVQVQTGELLVTPTAADWSNLKSNPTRYAVNVTTGALVAKTIQLADAQTSQSAIISSACQNQIFAGFNSSALGSVHLYPAKNLDQQNLAASVLASLIPGTPSTWTTPFWCQDSTGNWAMIQHTAAQIQQVGQDGKAAIVAALQKNATLQAQIQSATTVTAVQAQEWHTFSSPENRQS